MHESVLLKEAIDALNLQDTSTIVDCTLGYGGHSSHILKEIKKGFLFAFDQDSQAIAVAQQKLSQIASNYQIFHSNFRYLKEKLPRKVDGILFDLGVSSPQLDETDRGFSFHKDARLDMRMDQSNSLDAYQVVNTYSYEKLCHILKEFGEEKYASAIAHAIVKERVKQPITTTLELVRVIQEAVPASYRREKHPGRKTFQAIRIEVNRELEVLEQALTDGLDLLNVHGRMAVITFHSLEDRMVKQIFKAVSTVPKELETLPIIPLELQPKFKIIGVYEPSLEEISRNNRSRSAHLRVIERIKE